MLRRRELLAGAALAAATVPAGLPARAQGGAAGSGANAPYPTRPVRIVLPVAPGGATDTIGRVLADDMVRKGHGSFFVENRPGAGGNLAYQLVASSPPDGQTLLVGVDSLTVNPSLFRDAGYDPVSGFTPVNLLARIPHILVTHRDGPAKTFAEFMAIARRDPNRLQVAISGFGSGGHLSGAVIQHQTGARWSVIPYRGGSTPINDLMAGNVDAAFVTLTVVIGLIRSGQVLPLAITTPQRFPTLPDVPTVAETILPGYDVPNWYGLFAPAGTPEAVVARLNQWSNATMAEPAVRQTLLDNGFEVVGGPPEQLSALVRASVPRWRDLIRDAGLRAE